VWILGAKESPIKLPSTLYGTHTFDITSTTDSSSAVCSYRGLNLGYAPLCLQSQSHAVDFYFFGLLIKHLAGEQFATDPEMNLIATDTCTRFFYTRTHTLAPWSDKGLNVSNDYMEYMEV